MSKVALRSVSIRLGGKTILDKLDLEIEAGEFLVLLGPSGCGKSTLLHGIAGLTELDEGSVSIDGKDMTRAEPSERGIGMVFQSYALYPTMTVAKNMGFGLRMAGAPRAEIERRVAEAARMLQLEALLDRKPSQLSGGQRQRVAIGRALVRQAQVLLFDEPLSNLDAKLRTELRRELKLLHARLGATMIYVTHDQVEAMTLATRIVVLKDGRIQQIGTPEEVYRRPANLFVAGFLGAPAINLIEGVVDGERFTADGFAALLPGAGHARCEATLGVRPEHLRIDPAGPWHATVTLVEPMGNHLVVWAELGPHTVSLLAPADANLVAGSALALAIDPSSILLFDRTSGSRLS
ncbi:MAG TPA: ABC transporter ATP-binding protein [Telluria sp.]|nr:ABC transporter ATP-binding protein [Telluria sp.]